MNINSVEILENSAFPREAKKGEVFPQEAYEAKNFKFQTSIGFYSISKRISEIYLLERQ